MIRRLVLLLAVALVGVIVARVAPGPDALPQDQGDVDMKIVGGIAIVVGALVILGGLFVALRSVPDVRRYRRMRKM